ncbi:MAG: hypothetical protein ACJAXM_000325 [Arenicella sp.]|jgi:hypothetical protein
MQLWNQSETSVAIKSPKIGQQPFSVVVEYFCFELLMDLLDVLDLKAKSILFKRQTNCQQH